MQFGSNAAITVLYHTCLTNGVQLNGYGSFDSAAMKVKDDFKALYEAAGFGSIRYPGGTISNLFNWKTTIGPVEERKDQIHGFYNNAGQGGIAPNFGLAEIGTFAESVGSEIVYVYSLGRGNAQDAADLVEYLNARVGTNPNGGIDWAAIRAENGHPEPTTTHNPFTDVKESDFFYKAVLWAVEKGITNGTSATEFNPYAQCNRAQVVTFLYRTLAK